MMSSDRLHTIMNGITTLLNGGISVYFIYKIARHMMKPTEAYEYTKMLLFAGLGTIPIVFFTMMFAGKTELFNAFGLPPDMSGYELLHWWIFAGVLLLYLLPVVLFFGLWYFAGLRMRFSFFIFLFPILSRLILVSNEGLMITAGTQIFLFFISIFITMGIVQLMNTYFGGTQEQESHFLHIWPGYGTAVNMFFWICTYAIGTQFVEMVRIIIGLSHA